MTSQFIHIDLRINNNIDNYNLYLYFTTVFLLFIIHVSKIYITIKGGDYNSFPPPGSTPEKNTLILLKCYF